MNPIIEEISKIGIVPVIALEDANNAVPLANALMTGGINCAEVTFRTAAAKESIQLMTSQFPDMLVGAGTVLTTAQVDDAMEAGAKFIVSPGLNPVTVAYCIQKDIPVIPGTASPSDVEMALSLGLTVVKFFPAQAAGGLNMIKAMSAPYGNVKFMPTGGINADNLNEYLDFNKIIACGGSWMVKKDLVKAGNFAEIARLTKEAVTKMLGFEVCHIGINSDGEQAALKTASAFEALFGMTNKTGASSVFAGTGIEVMKSIGRGDKGHIAIGTNYIDRAVYYLSKQGTAFIADSAAYDAKGNLKAIYLEGEYGGFAVHLLQK